MDSGEKLTRSRLDPVFLEIPAKLVSEANQRGHWRRKYQRGKQQKDAVVCAWLAAGRPTMAPPVRVLITRIGPKTMDSDNLAGSAKAVRDAIAEKVLRTDDGSPLILWEYAQRRALKQKKEKYGCEVEVVPWSGWRLDEESK